MTGCSRRSGAARIAEIRDTFTIKHNVGVSVEHVYEVKCLDSDSFVGEL